MAGLEPAIQLLFRLRWTGGSIFRPKDLESQQI